MASRPTSVVLWDLPVRLVHWSFVLLLGGLWWSGENGDIQTHKTLGIVMLALLVFRVLWGLVGSQTARFSSFLKGPSAIVDYLRSRNGAPVVGHNPLGALSVIALLALLAVQVGYGLIAQDVDGLESGPLSHLVSYDTADLARNWHHLLFNVILAVVILHVLAVLFYLVVKRNNLVAPMITGRKAYDQAVEAPRAAPLWRLAVSIAIAGALAWWVSLGAPLPGAG